MKKQLSISQYLLVWILWAISSAWAVFIAFWAVLDAIRVIAEGATMRGYVYGTPAEQFQTPFIRNAVDRFGVLALGVACVLVVVIVEHVYRTGMEEGRLWPRVLWVTALEFAVLFLALAVQAFIFGILGLVTVWSVVMPAAALLIAAALGWLWWRTQQHQTPD